MVVPIVDVLIVEGSHVPVILLFDVTGSAGAIEFLQNGPIWLKVGVIPGVMVISIVVVVAHPEVGVKV